LLGQKQNEQTHMKRWPWLGNESHHSTFHSKNHSAYSSYFYYGQLHGKIVFVGYMILNDGEAVKLEKISPYTLLQENALYARKRKKIPYLTQHSNACIY